MSDIYSSPRGLITALATTIATLPPPPPPSFPMPLRDFFLLSISFPSGFVSLRRSPLRPPHLLFTFSPSFSVPSSLLPFSLSSAARRRPDERDNSSSIRLSAASLFGPLPITLFLLLSALREDFGALSAKQGGSAHCNFNQERCTREARQLVASARVRRFEHTRRRDKEFVLFPSSFFFFIA